MIHRKADGKAVSTEWHRRRREARENHHSLSEFSDIEIERYDLETAGVTGEDNPETYKGENFGPDPIRKPHDMRDDPFRGGKGEGR